MNAEMFAPLFPAPHKPAEQVQAEEIIHDPKKLRKHYEILFMAIEHDAPAVETSKLTKAVEESLPTGQTRDFYLGMAAGLNLAIGSIENHGEASALILARYLMVAGRKYTAMGKVD
jgi:hypothetical protein